MTDQNYKLVPVEPTEEMIEAAKDRALDFIRWLEVDGAGWVDIVKGAIAAAPEPEGCVVANRDTLADLIVREACETEPADPDDPETIKIRTHDLRWAALAAMLEADKKPAAPEPVCRWTPGLDPGWFWAECDDYPVRVLSMEPKRCGSIEAPRMCPNCGKKVEVVEDE